MTDITAQDRRDARKWADEISGRPTLNTIARAAIRYILATVDAPAPTLSEEWRDILEKQDAGEAVSFSGLLARTDQMEHYFEEARAEVYHLKRDLTEAYKTRDARADEVDRLRAEVENVRTWKEQLLNERDEARAELNQLKQVSRIVTTTLREQRDEAQADLADVTEVNHEIRRERDEARAEVEGINFEKEVREAINDHYDRYATQERAESNAESLDPADVPAGEAWLVEVRGERRTAMKDGEGGLSWNTVNAGGYLLAEYGKNVTLIARLVPAPRDPDELAPERIIDQAECLDRFRVGAVGRTDLTLEGWQRGVHGWHSTDRTGDFSGEDILDRFGPMTILYDPEEEA